MGIHGVQELIEVIVFGLAVFFMLIGVVVCIAFGLIWFIDVFRK